MDHLTRADEVGNPGLDVVVRLHAPDRIYELRRALFSIVCQDYRPVTVYLVTQRFSDEDLSYVESSLEQVSRIDPSVTVKVVNYSAPLPRDARSALMNLGIRCATGRYLAFLDYDDAIYNEAYTKLIAEANRNNCGIAFGKIYVKEVDVFADALLCNRRLSPFKGKGLTDLLRQNFCPIHSFLIDRSVVPSDALWFEESLDRAGDYDFLIRICSTYVSSFDLLSTGVGDYYYKDDGSNTIMLASNSSDERTRSWVRAEEFLDHRRDTWPVSKEVQRALGFSTFDRTLTVRGLLGWRG